MTDQPAGAMKPCPADVASGVSVVRILAASSVDPDMPAGWPVRALSTDVHAINSEPMKGRQSFTDVSKTELQGMVAAASSPGGV
ncbi:hypothetical protein [Tahibacter sp.]|uniref:hypothetical protein n=1 Tax=Tahibacter sp. TaxID=2056211 RepID=UPI0028C41889|nr:hypothetical protein [Tahibacter sp.]